MKGLKDWPKKTSSFAMREKNCNCSPIGSKVKGKFGGKAAKLLKGSKKGVTEVKV